MDGEQREDGARDPRARQGAVGCDSVGVIRAA